MASAALEGELRPTTNDRRRPISRGLVLAWPAALACACAPTIPPPLPDAGAPPASTDEAITDVRPAAAGVVLPFDAMPTADGARVYFTAVGAEGPALFRLDGEGAAPVQIAGGMTAPTGLVLSTDEETVFVADLGADEDDDGRAGVVWSVPADGGQLAALEATRGLRPRSLDLRADGSGDALTFTGQDPVDGQPGVFRLSLAGGAAQTLAKGAPLSDPSGVVVGPSGRAYVADATASENGRGAVLVVEDGAARVLKDDLGLGYPAGIALLSGEKTLLVSGLDPAGAGAQVYLVDVESAATTTTNAGIAGNDEAGGLHRAHGAARFAWSGSSTIYVLEAAPVSP